ncbi:Peptide methionine sulfoxide reductase MsrA [Trichinella pseudospiralis]
MVRKETHTRRWCTVYVEPKGLPGSQYPSATAVECCEGENGMVEPKGLPGSQYPTDTVVECCEGEDGMSRLKVLAEVGVLSILRILCTEPNEPKGLHGSQYRSATAVECCEGENGMVEPKGLPGSQYQLTQLLNAVNSRTEWLDLLTLKQLKELMHTGKFYELAV